VSNRVLLLMDDCGAGDAIRLSFCIRAVRESLPRAQLTLVVAEEAAAVYHGSPLVDRLIVSRLYRRPALGLIPKLVELGRLVRAVGTGHDLVIVFWWGTTLVHLLARIAGSGKRVGYSGRFPWLLSSRLNQYDFEGDEISQNELLLRTAGIAAPLKRVPEMAVIDGDESFAGAALKKAGWNGSRPLVLLHPGSDWACQQWPVDRWAALADGLANARRVHLVFTGAAGEEPMVESIRGAMSGPSGSLVGKLSLPQMAAALRNAALLVTVDSAIYLVARSQGTPTVVLAGPSHPERVGGVGATPVVIKKMDRDMEMTINECKRPKYPAGGCQDWSCPMAGLREIRVSDALDAARITLGVGAYATLGTDAQAAEH
jgi:ADP-heptose:LPS heptosyltransferase